MTPRNFRKFIFLFSLCSFLFSSYSPVIGEPITLVTSEYPPYCTKELANRGILVSIIVESFHAAGEDNVKIVVEPWYRALENAKKGKYDGIFTLWHTKERENWFAYSNPILEDDLIFFVHTKNKIRISKPADLHPYKIGTGLGYAYPEWFMNLSVKKEETAFDEHNFHKLYHHRVDIALAERNVGLYYIHKLKYQDAIKPIPYPIAHIRQYLGFDLKKKDYKKNLYTFNKGLSVIKANGTYLRIKNSF